jgi:hypothetical protein
MFFVFVVWIIFAEFFGIDIYFSNTSSASATCLISSPCKSMITASILIKEDLSAYLLEDANLYGEFLCNYSVSLVNANCKNHNSIVYASNNFCIKSQASLIISYINFDLTDFALNSPLISAIGILELYFVTITGGERIKGFTDSIISVFLTTSITFSGCEISNMYVYCNRQVIYIGLLFKLLIFIEF